MLTGEKLKGWNKSRECKQIQK